MEDVKPESARTKIIEVAMDLFAHAGFDGVSTRDIAAKSGLNVSLISYYFGGKEGLYKAVVKDFALNAQKELSLILKKYEEKPFDREVFCEQMRLILNGVVSMKIEKPQMDAILMREATSGFPYTKEIYEEVFHKLALNIVTLFKQGQKKGFIRKGIHPHLLFIVMVHSVDHYYLAQKCSMSMLAECPKLPEDQAEFIEQIYKIFVEGVLI